MPTSTVRGMRRSPHFSQLSVRSPAPSATDTHSASRASNVSGIPSRAERAVRWIVTGKALLILGIVAVALLGILSSLAADRRAPPRGQLYGAESQSAVARELAQRFPQGDSAPLLVMYTAADGSPLSDTQLQFIRQRAAQWASSPEAQPTLQPTLQPEPQLPRQPQIADDHSAAMVMVPRPLSHDSSTNAQIVQEVRDDAEQGLPANLRVNITGPAAFSADIAESFKGANFLLLAVTMGIVALLLLLTYRSPILWLLPLIVVALADRMATTVGTLVADSFALPFDSGIVSVLVFGAGTNYALLLISRYRDELRLTRDTRQALRTAWLRTIPTILGANVTVVLSLLTLVVAVVPSTRGVGVIAAIGLLIAVVMVMTLLPAALAVVGRGIFWPLIPRLVSTQQNGTQPVGAQAVIAQSLWHRLAETVVARPKRFIAVGMLVLIGGVSGLSGMQLGLSQSQQFREVPPAVVAAQQMSEHFPNVDPAPVTIIAPQSQRDAVMAAVRQTPGLSEAHPAGTSDPHAVGTSEKNSDIVDMAGPLVRVIAGTTAPTASPEARQSIVALRKNLERLAPQAVVGGQSAEAVDAHEAARTDFRLIAPLILLVVFIALAGLLRSLVAATVLIVVNVASAAASMGVGYVVGGWVIGFDALDTSVPLLAFLFLVGLGIDYTIFLTHRARQEMRESLGDTAIGKEGADAATRSAMVRAVTATGGVITSAGVVLAAVFAALGVLPLMTLTQLGFIVCLGVLVDTLLVRTVLIPAVVSTMGHRFWWGDRSFS